MHIAICDDDATQTAYLQAVLCKWSAAHGILISESTYPSAEALLFSYEADKTIDILLLDIQMPGKNGIELAKELRRCADDMQIVFVTGLPDFVAEGYDVNALHYLMKPVDEAKLMQVLDKAAAAIGQTTRSVLLESNGAIIKLIVREIMYVEAFAHSVRIETASGSYEARKSIGVLGKLLGDGFVRCHRSYLVGIRHISRITKTDVVLDSGRVLPLSRGCYQAVNQAFIRYFKEGAQ